jgi:hypothetical protein
MKEYLGFFKFFGYEQSFYEYSYTSFFSGYVF